MEGCSLRRTSDPVIVKSPFADLYSGGERVVPGLIRGCC